jgi:hypothetical protein
MCTQTVCMQARCGGQFIREDKVFMSDLQVRHICAL